MPSASFRTDNAKDTTHLCLDAARNNVSHRIHQDEENKNRSPQTAILNINIIHIDKKNISVFLYREK